MGLLEVMIIITEAAAEAVFNEVIMQVHDLRLEAILGVEIGAVVEAAEAVEVSVEVLLEDHRGGELVSNSCNKSSILLSL